MPVVVDHHAEPVGLPVDQKVNFARTAVTEGVVQELLRRTEDVIAHVRMKPLARAALVALTSDFEGVPNVLREALAAGVPVVSTDASVAVPEIIHQPNLGSIVPRDDPAALVKALDRWLAPDAPRPPPQPMPGATAIDDYLALFDALVRARS